MEGVTEFGARLWFWLCSAPDFLWTPFLRVTDSFPIHSLPEEFAPEITHKSFRSPYQLKLQYMASDPGQFLRGFEPVSDLVDVIDLNCGCPSPKVVGNGAGSSLLSDPEYFGRTIERLVASVGKGRLSVKMRLGYNHESEFEDLFEAVRTQKLAHLTIHGRTRLDRYTGKARWNFAEYAARLAEYPVIGSGDICSFSDFTARVQNSPSVQDVIIGRGALRNPWIFQEIRQESTVEIANQTLVYALGSFVLLEELSNSGFETLINSSLCGIFDQSIGTDLCGWQRMFEHLSNALGLKGIHPDELKLGRKSLGRLKMIWNYLRSSLPLIYFDPTILRSTSEGQLLARIANLNSDHPNLFLRSNPELDWIYSGSKSTAASASQESITY
jgi:tRNA-dihydrouridine synthase